jgi:acetyltransferase-like isoleucine patch superfamily enzyme
MTRTLEYSELLKRVHITESCPVEEPRPHALMLCKNADYLCLFREHYRGGPAALVIPHDLGLDDSPPDVLLLPADYPTYTFVQLHNQLLVEYGCRHQDVFAPDLECHDTTVIGANGMRFISDPVTGEWLEVLHGGNVEIGPNCRIGPHSVIHRGVVGTTRIGAGTKIGSLCSIGHGAQIGTDCLLTGGVHIAGMVTLGDRVVMGIGAVVSNGVSICDNVLIGAGAAVVHSIQEPGTYGGVPARMISPQTKEL